MDRKIEHWDKLNSDEPLKGWLGAYRKESAPSKLYLHFAFEFQIMMKGRIRRLDKTGWRTLEKGDVSFVGPWEPHARQVLVSGTQAITLIFLPVFLYSNNLPVFELMLPFLLAEARVQAQTYDIGIRRRVLARAALIRDALEEKSSFGRQLARLDVQRLLLELSRNVRHPHLKRPAQRSFRGYEKIFGVLEYISENMGRRLTVEDTARHFGMGRSRFEAFFKELVGTPFAEFILKIRLESARERMLSTDEKISIIAQRFGFSDASHLTRHFKRRFKITPGQLPRGERSLHL